MSTETKHTPLPWALAKTGVVGSLTIILANDERDRIATIDGATDSIAEDTANAAFIVRACNSHDDLVVACEAAKEWCARHRDSSDDQPPMTQLAAALDKAKGRKPFRLACFTYDRTNPTRR